MRHVHRSSLDFAFTPEHFRQEGPRLLCAVLNSIFPDKPVLLNLGLGSEQRGEESFHYMEMIFLGFYALELILRLLTQYGWPRTKYDVEGV